MIKRVVPVLVLSAGVVLAGCGKPPAQRTGANDPTAVTVKPWEAAGKRLRKDTDVASCKTALSLLNTDLLAASDATRAASLTPGTEAALATLVPLNPDDLAALRESSYTPHDPVYLAESLYLRDAARSLDVPALPGQTPEQIATDAANRGFAWVCRSIYLNPWQAPVPGRPGLVQAMPPVPPAYVLRRGYGSGLERMYVYLALLQQMGLDGCLIGPPEAKDQPATFPVYSADKKSLLTGGPRGPFWAVGVRIGNDIRLYDPWRGEAFPASFNALKANPEAHKAWFEDKANESGITIDDAKKAMAYLAVPVNSLAPRMATLEQQLKADLGAKLAFDPAAVRNAFPDPKPAFWNPPNDSFAYGRIARTFLPVDEGGSDSSPQGNRLFDQYMRSQFPAEVLTIPNELRGNQQAAERIRALMAGTYLMAFFNPGNINPRERIQRGQFQDAARDLVTRQDQFGHGLERLRNSPKSEEEIQKWASEAGELYFQLGIARTDKNAVAIQQIESAIEQNWKQNVQLVQLLIDRVSAELGHTEATFLLALCKHEQAERVQARLEHATGAEAEQLKKDAAGAWAAANAEWQTYAERARVQAGFTGRAAYVQTLSSRAAKLANQK